MSSIRTTAMALILAAFTLSGGTRAEARGVPPLAPKVKSRLVTDTASVAPGTTFRLGVHLELPDGWHTYWKNSGDSGAPMTIEVKAPAGFEVGTFELPTPKRWESSGIVGYGYEGSVLLVATVKAAATVSATAFSADVAWLVCNEEQCVPGDAKLTIEVGKAAPDKALFDAWADRFPIDAKKVEPKAQLGPGERAGKIVVGVELPESVPAEKLDGLEVLPAPADGLEVKSFEVRRVAAGGRSFEITFQASLRDGTKLEREEVELVLGWGKGEGRRGVKAMVPLRRT